MESDQEDVSQHGFFLRKPLGEILRYIGGGVSPPDDGRQRDVAPNHTRYSCLEFLRDILDRRYESTTQSRSQLTPRERGRQFWVASAMMVMLVAALLLFAHLQRPLQLPGAYVCWALIRLICMLARAAFC